MARDKGLEAWVSEALQDERDLTEKAMFGGWAWLLNGHLLCGARHDGLLVRLGKDNDGWALDVPGIEPMLSGNRRMHGWVRVAPQACGDDSLRDRLLDAALRLVKTLPGKS